MSGVPAVASSGTGVGERYSSRQISLYKFLRLAGDLLMPSLYTPYIQMLASLSKNNQASLHCFNLLKLNGLGSGGNAISWDHFFSSLHQYFVNLRQEVQVATSDTIYRLRSMTKGISPAEISGLAAVLRLVTVVSDYSEPARLAFAQVSSFFLTGFVKRGDRAPPVFGKYVSVFSTNAQFRFAIVVLDSVLRDQALLTVSVLIMYFREYRMCRGPLEGRYVSSKILLWA